MGECCMRATIDGPLSAAEVAVVSFLLDFESGGVTLACRDGFFLAGCRNGPRLAAFLLEFAAEARDEGMVLVAEGCRSLLARLAATKEGDGA